MRPLGKCYTPFDLPGDPGLSFEGQVSLADPSFARECDINLIVQRFQATGMLPQVESQGSYGDFTVGPQDFMEAQEIVLRAQAGFAALPAELRSRFGNRPERLLEFLEDPANEAEAVRLGLVEPPPVAPVAPEAPPAPVTQ